MTIFAYDIRRCNEQIILITSCAETLHIQASTINVCLSRIRFRYFKLGTKVSFIIMERIEGKCTADMCEVSYHNFLNKDYHLFKKLSKENKGKGHPNVFPLPSMF